MVKSNFILKKIFSIINERNKFKLIIHNKYLQTKLEININDFKRYSGRYIVLDTDGKVKEYNGYNDKLLFEGEYIKGKRYKGKEYDKHDRLIFEGEYLNNKWKKGKEY